MGITEEKFKDNNNDLEILKALLNGNHLNDLEIKRGKELIFYLNIGLKNRIT